MQRTGRAVRESGRSVLVLPEFLEPRPELTAVGLSELARSFWAKTGKRDPSDWLSVPQHLMDAADVAGQLFDH